MALQPFSIPFSQPAELLGSLIAEFKCRVLRTKSVRVVVAGDTIIDKNTVSAGHRLDRDCK